MLHANGSLTEEYDRAADGNVALTAEIAEPETEFLLALGFGRSASEAAFRVRASLQTPHSTRCSRSMPPAGAAGRRRCARSTARWTDTTSTASARPVLRCHESPTFPGGLIASLSIPWGSSKGDDDLGGYHLVWPRDLAQTAGAFLACGAHSEVLRVVRYLRAIQEEDGSWPQNCWLDGSPYWDGVQLDECAFPMLLLDMAWREGAMPRPVLQAFWPMVARASGFVVGHGPRTGQDRWEENAGYTPFTLAVQIAALLAAAELAEVVRDRRRRRASCATRRTPGTSRSRTGSTSPDTRLSREVGVPGYYVRIAPEVPGEARAELRGTVEVRNRFGEASPCRRGRIDQHRRAGAGALRTAGGGRSAHRRHGEGDRSRAARRPALRPRLAALQRRRLRRASTMAARIDGTGIGRVWPLLAGERAHYELAAGRRAEARTPAGGDGGGCEPGKAAAGAGLGQPPTIPERELFPGRPTGSAMPLVWAHAEHIKLLRSLADNAVFDRPPQTVRRYLRENHAVRCHPWRPDWRPPSVPVGRVLRLDLPEAALVHWSADGWQTRTDAQTRDTGLGIHTADIPADGFPARPGHRLHLDELRRPANGSAKTAR